MATQLHKLTKKNRSVIFLDFVGLIYYGKQGVFILLTDSWIIANCLIQTIAIVHHSGHLDC